MFVALFVLFAISNVIWQTLNFGVDADIFYDITENFFVDARYSLGLANLWENAPSGFSLKLSCLFAGLGY